MESIGEIMQNNPNLLHSGLKKAGVNLSNKSAKSAVLIKCQICNDGGWVTPVVNGKPDYAHPKRCRCMTQSDNEKRQASYLKYCELPPATEDRTFETFRTTGVPKLKEALEAAREVVAGKIGFLTLTGEVDRGKTHLAIAICRAWLAAGKSAKYAFVPALLEELKAGFKQEGDHSYESRFTFYQKVGLLVLDDLGAEAKTAWAIEKLETIIDYRYINELATVITTNKTAEDFTPRIRSRIQRAKNSRVVVITSPEHRLWKK